FASTTPVPLCYFFSLIIQPPPRSTLFPYTTLFRSDEEIFAELYREYHRPLLAFVLRLTGGDRQWAEDVVQETMIRAWRSADRLDDRTSSLMPWLATVSRRIVIDNRRQREVRPPEVGDGPLENLPMADEMDGLLRKVVVAEALESLSPAHRQALTE